MQLCMHACTVACTWSFAVGAAWFAHASLASVNVQTDLHACVHIHIYTLVYKHAGSRMHEEHCCTVDCVRDQDPWS
eukprot:352597-Chlamydomonas_euryale.AAC.7